MATSPRRRVLGERLIDAGLITQEDLEQALAEQKRTGEFIGTILSRLGLLTIEQWLPILAEQVGMSYINLADAHVPPEVLAKVPAKVATQYRLLPLREAGGALEVAIADPFDVQALDELTLLLGCPIRPLLASPRELRAALTRHYGLGASAVAQLVATSPAPAAPVRAAEDLAGEPEEAASVIALVNTLLRTAVQDRATDLHLEPYEGSLRLRERVDGILYVLPLPPAAVRLYPAIVSRLKVMAHLDIAERRLPQDGRLQVRLGDQALDVRVSVLPTPFGEAVELRLLSPERLFSLGELGLEPEQRTLLTALLAQPHGILFVTGPTGSGKTTTLYACLTLLNQPGRKLLTIEDPIEYQLRGITQLQVHPKIGFAFAQGLRAMLRHDPDVMMVGEVRDPETAEITIRSALTGHLVFSTLHTNDAAGGVTRLLDMGIEPYLLASSVRCFIAQRLVRLVCPACVTAVPPAPGLAQEFGLTEPLPPTLRVGAGCGACKGTGYQGRTAIYEFLRLTEPLQALILQRADAPAIARAAQAGGGFTTLRQAGWRKVCQGRTTPAEVLRVT